MIDIVTNNVKQIGTPADEGRVYISEKSYKRIKTEGFRDREVFILMGHTESSGGKYATFIEETIPVYEIEFEKNVPLWTNKVWNGIFAEIKKNHEEMIIVGWAFRQNDFPAEPTPMLENIHREHFGGAHQLMFLINPVEQEENFFVRKSNHLKKKSGFFVYYRINEHSEYYQPEEKIEERISVTLPKEIECSVPRRGQYRKMLNCDKKEKDYADEKSLGSLIMVGAIALLVVIAGIGAGGGLRDMLKGKESVPAISTEQQLIPVEKISGEWYTDK